MKKLSILLILLFTSIFALGQDKVQIELKEALNQINSWQKYKAEDLAFLAYYPGTPERSVQKVKTAIGELDMHTIMYTPKSSNDNAIYSVIRSDYPKEKFEDVDESYNDNVLEGAVKGAVNNVNGKLEFKKNITINGYPGKSIKVSMQGSFMYINAYLVDNSMFITQVICRSDKDGNASIDKFLKSFDIIKVK